MIFATTIKTQLFCIKRKSRLCEFSQISNNVPMGVVASITKREGNCWNLILMFLAWQQQQPKWTSTQNLKLKWTSLQDLWCDLENQAQPYQTQDFNFCLFLFTNDQSQTEWIVKFPDGVNTRHCIAATNQKRGKLIKMLYIIVANSRPISQLSDVGLRQQKHITRATIKPLSRFVISQLRCKQLAVASGPHPITGLHQH